MALVTGDCRIVMVLLKVPWAGWLAAKCQICREMHSGAGGVDEAPWLAGLRYEWLSLFGGTVGRCLVDGIINRLKAGRSMFDAIELSQSAHVHIWIFIEEMVWLYRLAHNSSSVGRGHGVGNLHLHQHRRRCLHIFCIFHHWRITIPFFIIMLFISTFLLELTSSHLQSQSILLGSRWHSSHGFCAIERGVELIKWLMIRVYACVCMFCWLSLW